MAKTMARAVRARRVAAMVLAALVAAGLGSVAVVGGDPVVARASAATSPGQAAAIRATLGVATGVSVEAEWGSVVPADQRDAVLGAGWEQSGDLTKDGKADVLGVTVAGKLLMYSGKGDGTFNTALEVGRGWSGVDLVAGADLDGDGASDIVGVTAARSVLFYKGKGNGGFAAAKQIATGW